MKINKVLVYNFKNFKEKTIIDFSDNVTFLVGPNGFGKTTIFDAIEIGLTGKLSRISSNENITPENIVYNKAFFQNDYNRPVIIKIWLEKENKENLVIVRKIEKASESKRNFAPKKSFKEFSLFEQKDIEDFESVDNINSSLKNLTQEEINNFLELQDNYSIETIYDLFNYIQQEETTFFLKQSEQKRSDSLAFLLRTSDIEKKVKNIEKVSKGINLALEKLESERDNELSGKISQVKYQRLFPYLDFVPFDSKEPFEENNTKKLNEYKERVKQILTFKESFSVEEYEKKISRDKLLNSITSDNNLSLDIINYILSKNNDFSKERYLVRNIDLLEYISLENYINNFEKINKDFEYRKYLENLLKKISVDIGKIKESHIANISEEILPESKIIEIKRLLNTYNELRNNLNTTEKHIEKLKMMRGELKANFDNLANHKHVDSNRCPFCNKIYSTADDLSKSYDYYSEYLTNMLSYHDQSLESIGNKLHDSLDILKQNIESKLSKIPAIDIDIKDRVYFFKNNKNKYSQRIEQIKNFISKYIKIPIYGLSQPLNWQAYSEQREQNKNNFLGKLPIDRDVYEKFGENNFDTDKIINGIKEKYIEFDITTVDMGVFEKLTLANLNQQVMYVKKQISQHVDLNSKIAWHMVQDQNGIFDKFFKQDIKYLKKCTKEDLENKIKYLDFQASLVTSKLSTKITMLTKMKSDFDRVRTYYENEVKKYKIDMIKNLRIPFFIYSAKILQNYQQGLGIFLTYKESSNDIGKKQIVKFITDSHNDHDALHQLSTGQLAVASLAFTLSLNTMFKLSEHLNFLVIDDPIQDMDSMNVLSFIEILRHNILKDYQLILSTYSDETALFMGYKFANSSMDPSIAYRSVRELQK